MKFLFVLAVGALVLGGIYREDIARTFAQGNSDGVFTAAKSVGDLGTAVGRNMQGIADKLDR